MEHIFTDFSLVIIFAAILSWVAVILRQPIIAAYMIAGVVVGPWGFAMIEHVDFIEELSHIGITLLLFLIGLELQPKRFVAHLTKELPTTLTACVINVFFVWAFCLAWGFTSLESFYIGIALMFSSTLLVIKMLPDRALDKNKMGSVAIAILIIQDIIAVLVLVVARSHQNFGAGNEELFIWTLKMGALILAGFFLERILLRRVMQSKIVANEETLYLTAFAWCMAGAFLAEALGFSHEIGAFIAGLALASDPRAIDIAKGLRFIRDFFLILFFFVLGAKTNPFISKYVLFPVILLAIYTILIRSFVYFFLFRLQDERKRFSKEISIRLGQASEFGIIVAVVMLDLNIISREVSEFIQLTVIATLILSSYRIYYFYSNPISVDQKKKPNESIP